jgi:4'-phosphopantetheinyl transferase
MDVHEWPILDRVPLLPADGIHVWRADLNVNEAVEAEIAALLSPDETARASRFVQTHDRRRFVVTRGSLRWLLGEYLGSAPATVPLASSQWGKPFLSNAGSGIRFSVAHSEDLALLAFARGKEIGVDLEHLRADLEWPELARRYFAPTEIAALQAIGESERLHAFFRCWTRKEAYVKALGKGLQVPLDGFAVTIAGPAALIHTSHDPFQRARWDLCDLAPAAGFAAAMCIEGRCRRVRRATLEAFR